MHARAAALFVVALLLPGAACEILAPAPVPEPPSPGWYLSTPVAGIRSLNDVIIFRPQDPLVLAYVGYAVGTDGTILKLTRDEAGVTTWTREESGTSADLESIDGFVDAQGEHIFVVGFDGTVLARDGAGWRPIASGTTDVLFDVTFRNLTDAFIVGDAGTILRWDGVALTQHVQQALQRAVGGVCPVAGCGANASCIDGLCNSFFPLSEPLKGVGDIGAMIVVGALGAVYRYDPNGERDGTSNRWIREDSGTQRSLAGIFTEAGVWVPTVDGVLMRRNGDDDWDDESFRTPAPVFLQDVWVDGADVVAVGLSEDIYHFDGDGQWQLSRLAEAAELRGVDGVALDPPEGSDQPPAKEIYVVGGGGRVARGPLVLPGAGELLLETRLSDDDFVN